MPSTRDAACAAANLIDTSPAPTTSSSEEDAVEEEDVDENDDDDEDEIPFWVGFEEMCRPMNLRSDGGTASGSRDRADEEVSSCADDAPACGMGTPTGIAWRLEGKDALWVEETSVAVGYVEAGAEAATTTTRSDADESTVLWPHSRNVEAEDGSQRSPSRPAR